MRVARKFRAKQAYYSNDLYAFAVLQVECSYRVRPGRLSEGVPAIVFGYPKHSGATDEGMTNGAPDIRLPGFWSRKDISRKALEAHQSNGLAWPRS
jgi:hypothetical protein